MRLVLAITGCALVACGHDPNGFSDVPPTDITIPPDVVPTRAGDPCGVSDNGEPIGACSAGQACLQARDGFPGGYCAPDCSRTACVSGSSCLPFAGGHRDCARNCTTDADCRVSEGYSCQATFVGTSVCLPNSAPVGLGPSGNACFESDGDAGTGPYMSPLPSVTFTATSTNASQSRLVGFVAEAENALAVDPSSHHGPVVGFAGFVLQDMTMYYRGGLTQLAPDGTYVASVAMHDRDYPDLNDVQVAFDRTGTLHVIYAALDTSRPSNPIRYAHSTDGGATLVVDNGWVFPIEVCNLRCQNPNVMVTTDAAGNDVLVATTVALQSDGTAKFFAATSPAAGAPMFTTPVLVTGADYTPDVTRAPTATAIAPGATPGAVLASWIDVNTANPLAAAVGDRLNRVRLAVSTDGGATFGAVHEVTRTMDAPVAQPPFVGTGGGATHVVYVTGGFTGVWNIVLATSNDAALATWSYRVVNDDDPCATHAFAGMAVDPSTGTAHIVWIDNRFGPGEVVYAHCPADPTQRCSRNEVVSGVPFPFTTSSSPGQWLGTHASVRIAGDGSLWAAWTDTRSGGSAAYVTHGAPATP